LIKLLADKGPLEFSHCFFPHVLNYSNLVGVTVNVDLQNSLELVRNRQVVLTKREDLALGILCSFQIFLLAQLDHIKPAITLSMFPLNSTVGVVLDNLNLSRQINS
jgi:hypothetical protein